MTARQPLFRVLVAALAWGWASTAWAPPGGIPTCQTRLNTCTADLGMCTTDLGTRTTDLGTCTTDLGTCATDLETSTENLGTCTTALETSAENLGTCTTNLATCNAALAEAQQFPATGQTTSLRAGDDGDIEAGAPLSYADTGDGTIIDNNTGLEWEKKSDDGSIHDKDTTYTWDNAFAVHVAGLNTEPCFAGQCDWRLSNVKELQSIVNYGLSDPAVSLEFNTNCVANATVLDGSCTAASLYWSSTTFANFAVFALGVDFGDGRR